MKKMTCLAVLIVAALGLGACGSRTNKVADTESDTAAEVTTEETAVETIVDTQLETTDVSSEETDETEVSDTEILAPESASLESVIFLDRDLGTGEYTDDVGNNYRYSYHIPQLPEGLSDADQFNQTVYADVKDRVDYEFQCMEDNSSLEILGIDWKGYQYGDLLTVVVSTQTATPTVILDSYAYDISEGSVISKGELISRYGLTEDTFLSQVREAATERFKEKYGYDEESFESFMNDYGAELFDRVNNKTQLSTVSLFVTEDGRLHVIAPVASVAGADAYDEELENISWSME